MSATNAAGYARWAEGDLPQGRPFVATRFWVRLVGRGPGQSVDMATLSNAAGSRHFDFFVAVDTGRFKWDVFRTSADESSFIVEPGR